MQPFPTPLEQTPALTELRAIIAESRRMVNEVASEIDSDAGADIIEAKILISDVLRRAETTLKRSITDAQKAINDVVAKVNDAIAPAIASPIPVPPGPGNPFPPQLPPIYPPPSPIPVPPIIPPGCPPCGPGGPGSPIEPPIIVEPPIDLPPKEPCPPYPPPPPSECPPCEPCPVPEPPPVDPCCPEPDYLIKICGPEVKYAKVNSCSPSNKCQPPLPIPIDPFPIKPVAAGQDCGIQVCVSYDGDETVQLTSQIPFPYNKGGEEHAFSPCGEAMFLADQAVGTPISDFLGYGNPGELTGEAINSAGGSTDFTGDFLTEADWALGDVTYYD